MTNQRERNQGIDGEGRVKTPRHTAGFEFTPKWLKACVALPTEDHYLAENGGTNLPPDRASSEDLGEMVIL